MANDIHITLAGDALIGSIKRLNGGNLAPPITNTKAGLDIRAAFAALQMPVTRLHDSPLENPGTRLVDVPLIFANFHDDAADPRNYYFRQTDDYIKTCVDGGTGIVYRLGPSIEHGFNKYFIDPPSDVDKWIDICSNIIRHYTEGWADGFHFAIKYWEIWNEPECQDSDGLHLMWGGTVAEYNDFYVKVATELKRRFPHLLIGGPAHCGFGQLSKDFISHCAAHQAPLDFYSYHCYSADPFHWIVESPAQARQALDDAGYTKAEIHLNEWHYFPGEWKRLRSDPEYKDRVYEEMKGIDSAAFICAVQTLWQDTPLDLGCYYTATASAWGLFKTRSAIPTKSYYGMKAFGEIALCGDRLKTSSDRREATALAGRTADGKTALLVAAFKTGPADIVVDITGIGAPKDCVARMVDDSHDLTPVDIVQDGNTLRVKSDATSAVLLVTFTS